jgi:hypothetical protein
VAKFTPVDYLVGPVGPSMDVDRPAPPPPPHAGPGANPITLLLQAAGALVPPAQPGGPHIRTRLPHVEIEHAPPAIPDPNDTAPTGRVPDYGPQGAVPVMPPVPAASPAPAMPVAPMAPPETAPLRNVAPVNDDLFGQFIRAGMRVALPAAIGDPDRAASIFRLFADKAWRDNSLAGSVVSDYESGRGLLSPRLGPDGRLFTPTPDQLPPDQRAVYDERQRGYNANRAEKQEQTRALGPMSGLDQALAIISSIVGSAASPESAVGPGGAMYAKAGTLGKMALGAGVNAGVVGATDPIAQSNAVARGDRLEYSPAEHALATGGAALLGAIIPGIAGLFRRGGALKEAAPVSPDADIPPKSPVVDTPPVDVNRQITNTAPPAQGVDAVQRAVKDSLARMDERMGVKPADAELRITPPENAEKRIEQSQDRVDVDSDAFGAPPKSGLVVAARDDRGNVYYGRPGEIHAELMTRYDRLGNDVVRFDEGFAGSDGRFLTREEALRVLPKNDPARRVNEVRGAKESLDAVDYNDAHRVAKPATGPAIAEAPRADSPVSPVADIPAKSPDVDTPAAPPAATDPAVAKAKQMMDDALGRMDQRMGVAPSEKPPQVSDAPPVAKTEPATQPDIPAPPKVAEVPPKVAEVPPARAPEAPAKPAIPVVVEAPQTKPAAPASERVRVTYKDGSVAEATKIGETSNVYHLKLDNGGEIKPLKKLVQVEPVAKETPRPSLDKQDVPAQKADVPITRVEPDPDLAKSVDDIPDFMRRPVVEKEKPDAPVAPKPAPEEPRQAAPEVRQERAEANPAPARAEERPEPPRGEPAPKPAPAQGAAGALSKREKRLAKNEETRAANKARLEENAKIDRPPMETVVMHGKGQDSPSKQEPAHPFTDPSAPKTDLHAGIGTNAIAKAAGPETIGALVGGMVDHWEEHGRFGLTTRGMIAGALAVAALRHRMPGLSKSVVGKDSFATSALKGLGDLAASTRLGRQFHPTMGVEQELWDKLVKVKVETRNFQDDALKIAKIVRENTTPDERIAISDWIERRDLEKHGINTWQAADDKVKKIADALVEHVDGLGERLVAVKMLDRASFDNLRGEYLHRYYLPKLAEDKGYRQAAARMKASASYALRRGETAEGVDGAGKVGETVTQWTHAQSGEVKYGATAPGPEWIGGKQWKVERVRDDGRLDLHRDYTPQERTRMGEIRDANFRFAMGSMEASRDLALGTMFQQIARNAKWASASDPGGWKLVPATPVGQGSAVKKWGELAGKYVAPEVWDALKIVRKPWSPDEMGSMGGIMNGYLKALGMWKVGKTAYNPATHFNNVMGNVSLAALTGEVGPVHLMKALGALRRKDPVIEEARRAGLSLGRESNLGDTFDGLKIDVGIASGLDPRSGWAKLADWWTNNMIVRAYQAEDSVFKLGAYMRRRAAGESPESAVANVHKVFFDYADVPLGVQATRDFYSPFFTYTYKYAQVMARELAERPHRYLAAYGMLSALNMMSYDWMYGDRAKAVSDYEREMSPKWLKGRSGFGAEKAIRLPWNEKDPVTGENRAQMLNTRYMVPGGDILDWVANGNMGPTVWPQVLGNTIFGGNPLINTGLGLAFGKDMFFDKSFYPYPDTSLWDWEKRPTKEVLANWGTAIKFMAMQALPPSLYAAPEKLGQAATGEGLIEKGGPLAEFMGWTGTDFAGRQRSIAKAVASVLGVKVEDVAPDEAKKFREHELHKEVRDNLANARKLHGNQSVTDTRRENARESLMDRVGRFQTETRKIRDLQEKAGAR